jgi:hypothetical protein
MISTIKHTKKGIQYDGQGYEQARCIEVAFIPGDEMTCDIVAIGSATHRADELQFIDGVLSPIDQTVGMGWTIGSSDWRINVLTTV